MKKLEAFKDKKILITGNTGFKGAWLTQWLLNLGASVTGFSIDIPSTPSLFSVLALEGKIDHIWGDVRNKDHLQEVITEKKPDFIFHLAAQPLVRDSYNDPHKTYTTNIIGTLNVLESLRALNSPCVCILITSDKCYENVEQIWGYRESDRLGGKDPYSSSKACAELVIKSYVNSFFPNDGLVRLGVGRAGNVIGGGDWAGDRVIPDSVRAWSEGRVVFLRNPLATRPWQHVLEPLSGYLNLALALKSTSDLHGQAFNFGPAPNQNYSVVSLVSAMEKYWPNVEWEDISEKHEGPFESGLLKLDCDKAFNYLHWHSVWSFELTVRETTLWYKEYYSKSQRSIKDFTWHQIESYMRLAKEQGLEWAQ